MLNSIEKRFCAESVRRAGFPIDDQTVYVAITDIETGKGLHVRGTWVELLSALVGKITKHRGQD